MDISESEDIMGENELEKRLIEAAEKAKSLESAVRSAWSSTRPLVRLITNGRRSIHEHCGYYGSA